MSSNIRNDARRDLLSFQITLLALLQQSALKACREFHDFHHSTILFKGYSTIPCAFADLSFGRICRTTASSIMVFTATQSGLLNVEIVGFFRAGSTLNTASRCSRFTFSISPTLLLASIAPLSIRTRSSAFSRFHPWAAASRFMMKTVADSSTVSTILRRLARKDEPVSVSCTM